MRNAILAAGLAAGMGIANAVVLIPQTGGNAFLGTTVGSGSGFVSYDGAGNTFVAMFDFSGTDYGYIVECATDKVVENVFVDAAPVHFANSTEPEICTEYYLATSTSVLNPGDLMVGAAYESECFHIIPEPATYALLAGLGLIGFAGYRRFRS